MKAKITVVPSQPTKEDLRKLYDVCNKLFKSDDLFYSSEQVKALKLNKKNIWM